VDTWTLEGLAVPVPLMAIVLIVTHVKNSVISREQEKDPHDCEYDARKYPW
jgi:hypothetical protein